MKRDPLVYLWDVRHAANTIFDFVGEQQLPDYLENTMLRSAVERQFEIIGEALNQLNKQAPDIGSKIPFLRNIVDFRNLLIHGYASINHGMVWKTIEDSLPELVKTVDELIKQLDENEA